MAILWMVGMKRRSFIGSLLALIPAAFILPRIPKPAPEGIPCTIFTPPSTVVVGNAEGFELGDMVYWDSDERCLKAYPPNYPPEYQRVMGIVVDSGSIDNKSEITLGGM